MTTADTNRVTIEADPHRRIVALHHSQDRLASLEDCDGGMTDDTSRSCLTGELS
jgi:hypothetical protein